MTIITVFDAERRQERGWDDPGYPIGIWQANGVASHDASGGSQVTQINLATADVPEGLAYSLEHYNFQSSANTASRLVVQAVNFDTSALSISRGQVLVDMTLSGQVLAMPVEHWLNLPWFLGVVVDRSIAAAISLIIVNVTGKTTVFSITGYVWGPRAVLQVPGGYRRPPDGMFGI